MGAPDSLVSILQMSEFRCAEYNMPPKEYPFSEVPAFACQPVPLCAITARLTLASWTSFEKLRLAGSGTSYGQQTGRGEQTLHASVREPDSAAGLWVCLYIRVSCKVCVRVFTLQEGDRRNGPCQSYREILLPFPWQQLLFSYISYGLMLAFPSDILNQTAIGWCICSGFISCPPTLEDTCGSSGKLF